jgi:hypothetical protein
VGGEGEREKILKDCIGKDEREGSKKVGRKREK